MKLTNNQVFAATLELKEESKALHNFNHPYGGMFDKRGSMTRYPLTQEKTIWGEVLPEEEPTITTKEIYSRSRVIQQPLIERSWMQSFIANDGSVDSMGVYGINPYATWIEKYSPSQVAGWLRDAHLNRWDCIPRLNRIERYVTISDTATLADLYRMDRGCEFIATCESWGYNPLDHGKSIFWCFRKFNELNEGGGHGAFVAGPKFIKFIADKYTAIDGQWINSCDFFDRPQGDSYLEQYIATCVSKYKSRCDIRNEMYDLDTTVEWSRRNHNPVSSIKAARFAAANIDTRSVPNPRNLNQIRTSQGWTWYGMVKGEFIVGGKGVSPKPRNVAGVWVVKISSTCFAWDKSFHDHNEGATVKEAVDAFLGRTGIETDKVSFQMVRKAKGFCLPGTREWLNENVPFLGHLLQPFSNWDQVPSDLMNTVWEFSSRDVFKGRL